MLSRLSKCMLYCLILLCMNACTTIRQDGSTVRHYFGYVKVITPPTVGNEMDYRVMEVSTSGLRIENGVGVGYFYERNEYIPLVPRNI